MSKPICPGCKNDDQTMIEQRNHRREQVDCYCEICSKSWVHMFTEVPPEKLVKKGIKSDAN